MLEVVTLPVGPLQTNAYLLGDSSTGLAAVIDPGGEGERIYDQAAMRNWHISSIWYTHAHFDHIGGTAAIADRINPLPVVALHPLDYGLWRARGGALAFGINVDPGPEPTVDLYDGQELRVGQSVFTVHHTPGHTPGHCVFHAAAEGFCICGDLIFRDSVGRTDLPGGDPRLLMSSIEHCILVLPDETRLLSGHSQETTVGRERRHNPFLTG